MKNILNEFGMTVLPMLALFIATVIVIFKLFTSSNWYLLALTIIGIFVGAILCVWVRISNNYYLITVKNLSKESV